jgi:hypothetical protein
MRPITKVILRLFAVALLLAAADPVTPGKYTGKWQGDSGAGGEFVLTLSGGGGGWKAEVSFTMGDQSVPCKVSALSVDGAKVHVVYTFDLLGAKLESTIDGERAGAKLSGKYRTRNVDGGAAVDQGTWEASAG